MRLTGTIADVYQYLEPLYNDYRKIRDKLSDGRMIQCPLNLQFFFLKLFTVFFPPQKSDVFHTDSYNIIETRCKYLGLHLHGYPVFISGFTLTHVDQFIDEFLTKDYSCDTVLPHIHKNFV